VTRTRYGVSPWLDDFPRNRRPDFPRFRGTAAYPVVIVGGGLAGCLTAYAFAAAGVRVALLEADRVGHGGAGRGPGILQGEAAPSYRDIETRHGRKAARALFESSRRAVLDLATTARRLGVKSVVTGDAVRVLSSYTSEEKAFAKELALRRDIGLDAVGLKTAAAVRESGIDAARAAMKLRDWGEANPYHVLVAFAAAAAKRGAAIYERTSARRIKIRRRNVEIAVEGGTLTADTVIVCTAEPTDLYRSLKRHLRLDERYVVMTDRIPATVRKQTAARARVLTNIESPPHFVRWTDDGRVVIAGADQPRTAPRGKDKVLVQRTGQLMYELSRMYPAISGTMPARGWDLPLATTSDGVMYAGPHRNYPRHLFAWGTRHDPAQAFLASRILLRNYQGAADRDDSFFAFTRGG
jgi:glycine/D-amino acid oxidase-like deaminating enzyme